MRKSETAELYNSAHKPMGNTPGADRLRKAEKVVCVSWNPALAETRRRLLIADGYAVVSLIGSQGIPELRKNGDADLLVLAHSVPIEEKRRAVGLFKERSTSPVLSLLLPHQSKLPEADYGIEVYSPRDFLDAVKKILQP